VYTFKLENNLIKLHTLCRYYAFS